MKVLFGSARSWQAGGAEASIGLMASAGMPQILVPAHERQLVQEPLGVCPEGSDAQSEGRNSDLVLVRERDLPE